MKRKNLIKAGLAIASAVAVMTGCGNKSTVEATTAAETTVAAAETKSAEELTDEASITLGEYKGLTLTSARDEITDDEVEERMSYLVEVYPPIVTDRPAELGHTANIDYEGTKDDVTFDGGTAYGYDLKLGSGEFIEGFEEGIVGMMPGEERDLHLTFPEEYHSEELAGQDVVFHVTLNEIKDVNASKLDDELAKRVLDDENADLDALRAHVRKEMELSAEVSFYLAAGEELINQLVEKSEITCDPDAVEALYNEMCETYGTQASYFGMELADFMTTVYNVTLDELKEIAESNVKQEMVMNELIKAENLAATEEQRALLARMNKLDTADEMIATYGEEEAERLFNLCAGSYFLIEHAVAAEAE